MRRTASALLAIALFTSGCTEPIAPAGPDRLPTAPVPDAAPFTDRLVDAGNTGAPIDVHAIHVNIESRVFDAVVIDRYSFHAHGRPDDIKGTFHLYQMRNVDQMECATVQGSKARVGGTITWTSLPAFLLARSSRGA